MGKSSSSKRKRSRYSPQGRTKKKSKTRRSRSKKLLRHDDSVSYASEDSRSPLSVSSSSEDTYQGRRSQSRSCTRKDVKVTKRRARSSSSGSEDSHRLRKQKRSRKKDGSEARKKITRKKKKKKSKSRRSLSISSRSTGSWSCSTCQSSSSSSDDSEYENRRGRSKRRDNNARKLKNVKGGTKRSRYRSRSCSSCSRHIESSDYQSEMRVTGGNISKRLRSIITLPKEDEEERELDWEGHKEEMIYDHDDYPSSKSNDSNDGVNKMALAHQSYVAYDEKRSLETEEIENTVSSKPAWDGVGTNDAIEEKNNDMSKASGNMNNDDLESSLRQKALENLRRFRGGFQTNAKSAINQKDTSDGTLKSPSIANPELRQTESLKYDGAQGDERDSAYSVQKDEKVVDEKRDCNESVPAKSDAHLPDQLGVAGREKVSMGFGSGISKTNIVTSALKQALSNATTAAVEMRASQVSSKAKLVNVSRVGKHTAPPVSGNDDSDKVDNTSGVASAKSSAFLSPTGEDVGLNKLQDTVKEVTQLENMAVSSVTPLNSSGQGVTVNNTSTTSSGTSSHLTSEVRDISSNKVQDDGKDGSQLEQKTMSVMRGGEMVQVSYKVYIPKKTPALARRQLKR